MNPITPPERVVSATVSWFNQLLFLFSAAALKSNISATREMPSPMLAPISAPPGPPTTKPTTPPASAFNTYCKLCAISSVLRTPSWSNTRVSATSPSDSPTRDPTIAPGTPPRINPTPAPVSANSPASAFSAICSPVRSDQSNNTSDTVILKSLTKSWSACETAVSSNIAE